MAGASGGSGDAQKRQLAAQVRHSQSVTGTAQSGVPSDSYLTLHSPRGACAHFALGQYGTGGGFGLHADRAASAPVFVGIRRGNTVTCLPFFRAAASAEAATFLGETAKAGAIHVATFAEDQVQRRLGWASDRWQAPGIAFELLTPVLGIPDPERATTETLRDALVPAIAARLTIDNRDGTEAIQGFFAVHGLRGLRLVADETAGRLTGWVAMQGFGFACIAADHPRVRAVAHWDLPNLFTPPHPSPFVLAAMGALLIEVPAGEQATIDLALGWHLAGTATHGLHRSAYAYTRWFADLPAVLGHACARLGAMRNQAAADDAVLERSALNPDQRMMLAQATRSYWASTMLFDDRPNEAQPQLRWVVNEGSFMMLNTFDLLVDHVFFELDQQPWTVRNVLDAYVDDWSYRDQVHRPGDPARHPGGISFCHDHGSFFTFTPRGHSSYEIPDQPGCYSYMTQEQLVNWVLCAGMYLHATGDTAWGLRRKAVLLACLESLEQRDDPDPARRDGVMDADSSRTGSAEEITTYDSLDPSLGQARRNLYLAVKTWAAYLALAKVLRDLGEPAAAGRAAGYANLAARTIVAAFDPVLGYIPALLDGHDRSAVIPAIEGLAFPGRLGLAHLLTADGPYGSLVERLRQHLVGVMQPGRCRFADGGWKLSANSGNSWISKVFLCQHIARTVLGLQLDTPDIDRIHADWWRIGSAPNPGIDQIIDGRTSEVGFYYPRAITSWLWLDEARSQIRAEASHR